VAAGLLGSPLPHVKAVMRTFLEPYNATGFAIFHSMTNRTIGQKGSGYEQSGGSPLFIFQAVGGARLEKMTQQLVEC